MKTYIEDHKEVNFRSFRKLNSKSWPSLALTEGYPIIRGREGSMYVGGWGRGGIKKCVYVRNVICWKISISLVNLSPPSPSRPLDRPREASSFRPKSPLAILVILWRKRTLLLLPLLRYDDYSRIISTPKRNPRAPEGDRGRTLFSDRWKSCFVCVKKYESS